ncbi:Asp-tRNA(Asn)/Glu-tRNA(Gln) amidotransferase GatCAB subunit C [candidate division KSB1 bacterium]|nr:MAG: Asp-tRNA(Asn)/Glu-tRNA(Gln) amidotransferase GatCAB subunit C [candidate division KSB1 bacterium]RKY80554.1 MAG: Asp-tRNA(Asn)/Glu-tRNA(Gln) amidotransferase GatCAB subunit C [candidate division KSB1 bacterium]RKY85771.1 MAG: Asp-tRNA(Asn)/Glu-tRNA(Gln) amidotransferase GatCAB subunit C [candidate division KSB1 bacterium]RKY88106.1 MAG: Asp-tRNA(Asn)/Glu-tRNA(Gln) amidotransferase GatCAB subunit C [candidate division KSB1 bacterium]RKY90214.1 MAG: Asp-tRNA(Asn)/Glu-tRNA(Gln) amidotransf
MAITVEEVEHIAQLAKLKFSEEEKKKFTTQLAKIIQYVEKLNELDTEDVPPTYHVLDIKNVMRSDVTKPWLTQEEALKNAPRRKDGFFSVPKVIIQE